MNSNQGDDILNLEEIAIMLIKRWKALVVITVAFSLLAFAYCRLATPLYVANAVIIPGGTSPQPSSSLLAAFGGFPTAAFGADNSEKIKLYATSSQVLQNVLKRLDPKTLADLGLAPDQDNPNPDWRSLGFKMAKWITVENLPNTTTAIQISVETPSAEASKICLIFLLEEIRDFYNELEQIKLKKQEAFFQNVSENYRKQMLKYSLGVSLLPDAKNGMIELTAQDLGLSEDTPNIQTTPQSYFEYKSAMQEMYRTFAKSLEQSFQSLRIDIQRQELLFDITESPYALTKPSSPNVLKVLLITAGFIFFTFSFYVFVVPTFKSIFTKIKKQ